MHLICVYSYHMLRVQFTNVDRLFKQRLSMLSCVFTMTLTHHSVVLRLNNSVPVLTNSL